MTIYVRNRLLAAIPVIFGVSLLVFSSLYLLPGDPVQAIAGDVPLEKERIELLREQLGLNEPPWVQYGNFALGALQGDLGTSIRTKQPVLDMITTQLPATLQLTFAAMLFAIIVGIGLGTIAAIKAHTWVDSTAMVFALGGVSIPAFWLGLMLLIIFAVGLRLVPSTGTEGLHRLILPAFVLGYAAAAIIARLTRSSLLEAMSQEYMTTARAKGLQERRVISRHALKNALIPVITIVGLQIGTLLSGAVIVETVFSRQGIGRLLITGINSRDFPVVQGTVLFVATAYVLINIVTDVLYAWADPRIRYDR